MKAAHSLTRRNIMKGGLLGLVPSSAVGASNGLATRLGKGQSARAMTIARIECVTVKLPFREVPGRNMARELPHWAWTEICEVHLQSGHVGYGETLLYYTWGAPSDEAIDRAGGQNAAELMWDDSLGAGLQMALFDAVARAADVPIHCLLGRQLKNRVPLAWWNIDTSPEDMAAECKEAFDQGYRSYKTKGRPWFDVWAQADAVSQAVPDEFKLTIDFNDTLLDAERAIPILQDLAQVPEVAIYETPIPQSDIAGNQAIRKATRVPVAMHYGNPKPLVAIKQDVCDGYVVGGGASAVLRTGAVAAMANQPFWLQQVGSDITAAFSLHFGAVLSHATWPAVNCHQLFAQRLLTEPIGVHDGYAAVPEKPGLGCDIDRDAVVRFRVDKPQARPDPPRLIETRWPDGRRMYVANSGGVNFMLTPARKGSFPYFERGVTTQLIPDDGSTRWRELYERARSGPITG